MGSTWRRRASALALVAGAVSVAVLLVEGPPGSGYGWGSVAVSAGIVAALFAAMAFLVRSATAGRAVGAAVVAVLVIVITGTSLLGNWGAESAGFRTLDVISTVVAVLASGVVLAVSIGTVRDSRSPRSGVLR